MQLSTVFQLLFVLVMTDKCNGISSPVQPFIKYKHSTELQSHVADLWWTVDDAEQEITFELHIKTTGWIALGISPAGGMTGADIGVGWVDNRGNIYFQDRYAFNFSKPVIDNTTIDWFAIQGREENGWTAIQFKRLLDTCDPMDVAIKSGTHVLIFAYGLADPDMCQPNGDISYHDTRRGTRIIPLRSYGDPPTEEKFGGLDSFDFRLNNTLLPSTDTTYYCKVFKVPSRFTTIRHAIGAKIFVDTSSQDLVHHMTTFECDLTATFDDDSNLPEGDCDENVSRFTACTSNIANGWAIGGDYMVEFPEETGYPVGGDLPIKYYMVQIHFDNPRLTSNRRDSSGIRFYIGKERRKYDIGYITIGADSNPGALVIPPKVDQFMIDSYCPNNATQRLPESGITIISTFPHTHLQGKSVWTKLIRNNTAIQYVFNAESFNFNYQFENRLPKPIKLYRGDSFLTRCVYNTLNKNEVTLGGKRTRDEMCLHTFTYYPRMDSLYFCLSTQSPSAWQTITNNATVTDMQQLKEWIHNITWTSESVTKWQEFYKNSSRYALYGGGGNIQIEPIETLPKYQDLKPMECSKQKTKKDVVITTINCNSANCQTKTFILLAFIPFIVKTILIQ